MVTHGHKKESEVEEYPTSLIQTNKLTNYFLKLTAKAPILANKNNTLAAKAKPPLR